MEPLSDTPYSYTSIDRSLDGVFDSAARVSETTRAEGLATERGAWRIDDSLYRLNQLIDQIVERAKIAGGEKAAHVVEERLKNRRDQWSKRRAFVQKKHQQLVYEKIPEGKDGEFSALLLTPENQRADVGMVDSPPFTVANSIREVQPEMNLLVTRKKENLMSWEL